MVQFNLSINNTEIRSKSEGQFLTGFSVKNFDLVNPDDVKKLERLFQSNCYSNNEWGNPKEDDKNAGYQGSCSKTNYVGMHGIVLDIDEPGLTINDAKEKFKDYVHLIHTSASHQVDLPEKGGKIDRYRIILPFEPQDNDEPYYTNKNDAERLYNYLKRKYPESDSSILECARKFYPFAGQDRSQYQFHHNAKGRYISFDLEEIEKEIAAANTKNKNQHRDVPRRKKKRRNNNDRQGSANDSKTKENVTTHASYYSPTGEEYVMPDEIIKVKINDSWVEKKFQEIKELMLLANLQKIPAYCNHCDDRNSQTASAFIYQDFKGFFIIECSHCKAQSVEQYKWREYPVSDAMFAQNKKIYEIKVRSAEHISPHELSREEWKDAKEANFAFQYIKKNRFFLSHNFTINYYSKPELSGNMPEYELNFKNNEINITYPIAKSDIEDNAFINNYLHNIFGDYDDFIKNWLALYTYTNYESLPVLVLVGGRATGKNTFVQMVGDIYNMLWAQWSGDRENFNSYYTKKLLWIDENAFGDKKSQYDEIKYLTGNKYVTVNEKFQPRYRVHNNIKVILTTNDFKPLAVKNEEAPKSEKDNNFFFYQFAQLPEEKRDSSIGEKLKARIGYYCRTELKQRYEDIKQQQDLSCRYIIPCPITEYSKEIYVSAKTDLELAVEELIEYVENAGSFIKYSDLNTHLKDLGLLRNGYSVKHFLTMLQKKKVIGMEQERTASERLGYRVLNPKKKAQAEDPFDIFDDSLNVSDTYENEESKKRYMEVMTSCDA